MMKPLTGAQIRQSFIDFFLEHGHTFVASSSLVPGGDATLLFTNAGMVQFKDVFLGTDHRPYTRAVNSQKCMRVAGKHNDLDDVGRDDTHHTFFEMLGNWSFGDYYKAEAISWAWELLTRVWGLNPANLWTSYFQDDKGNIPADDEAAEAWRRQPGIDPTHVLPFGRKDNFWEMAETGPCGPCTEINVDRGLAFCNKQNVPGHVCSVNGDCQRFTEIWNLVFIQYNRLSATELEPLPSRHVDTGMGLERIVSILQDVPSNYATDLLSPVMDAVQELSNQNDAERQANITPYRVLADHSRTAAFLIADGVVPGNIGRNYVCRMIVRRAARFGRKLGLTEPFMANLASVVVEIYGDAYPELRRNQKAILDNLTREEKRFQRTIESGLGHLDDLLAEMKQTNQTTMDGTAAFDLYATHGLPLEITRDIAREQGLDVDEVGFRAAMEEHRLASGGGKAMGSMGGEDVEVYRSIFENLQAEGKLDSRGVAYDPYSHGEPIVEVGGSVLALLQDGFTIDVAQPGSRVEIILPKTCLYVESGGQVSDYGTISAAETGEWEIRVDDIRKPAAGLIVHVGEVTRGTPRVGDEAIARVDMQRRRDIMRNHTGTHLLHAELQRVLGEHARQAGSSVTPDRLRFDFTHPEAISAADLEEVEAGVNRAILANQNVRIVTKSLSQAMAEGAMALFGEKYGEEVRTVTIGDAHHPHSYELCGGTHVENTNDIGLFLIVSEGSAAAGVRRIEAVTGRGAYELVQLRTRALRQAAGHLACSFDELPGRVSAVLDELGQAEKQVERLRQELVAYEFDAHLQNVPLVNGVPVLTALLPNADAETLRHMTDRFRQRYPSGVVVLGSAFQDRPVLIAAITDDLIKRGLQAGNLVKSIAGVIGGSGGGRPNLAQAGGKDPGRLSEALDQVIPWVKNALTA